MRLVGADAEVCFGSAQQRPIRCGGPHFDHMAMPKDDSQAEGAGDARRQSHLSIAYRSRSGRRASPSLFRDESAERPCQLSVNDSLVIRLCFPVPLISVSVYLPGSNSRLGSNRKLMCLPAARAVPDAYTTP
jgi:hypothetical protein